MNVATHSDDPGLAAATVASYANPASRMLNMLPTAFKADKANKGEDEFKRQQKFKTQKEETEMTDEVKNPLIDAFLALQDETGNMFEAAKHLSDKQKKIAKVAGDKSKIDAADFAALRAGKKVEEEVEEIDEISGAKVGAYMVASKKDETARREKGIEVRDQLRKETGMHFGTPIDRKLHSPTASRGAMQKLGVSKLTGTAKVPATEDVEFSPEELAHFDSVLEALGQSKDATQKGSFKKASGTNPNGDPVRPTVPERDLTDDVNISEAGRPKKVKDESEPTHPGRDPKQHIQVIAGQAAAGRHIDFHHNDGSKTTISPQKGREIVSKLNSMKPAERHAAVNKMHDSSKGM